MMHGFAQRVRYSLGRTGRTPVSDPPEVPLEIELEPLCEDRSRHECFKSFEPGPRSFYLPLVLKLASVTDCLTNIIL